MEGGVRERGDRPVGACGGVVIVEVGLMEVGD